MCHSIPSLGLPALFQIVLPITQVCCISFSALCAPSFPCGSPTGCGSQGEKASPVLPAPRKWPGRWKGLTKALLPEGRTISERHREMMYRSQCRAEPRALMARLELFLCQDAKAQAQLAHTGTQQVCFGQGRNNTVSSSYGRSLWQERKVEWSACGEVLLPEGLPNSDKSGTPSSPISEPEIFLGSVTCATFARYLGEKEGGTQRRVLRPVASGQRQSSPLPMAGLTRMQW